MKINLCLLFDFVWSITANLAHNISIEEKIKPDHLLLILATIIYFIQSYQTEPI